MSNPLLKRLFPQTVQLFETVVDTTRNCEEQTNKALEDFNTGVTRAQARIELLRADPTKEHAILFVFGDALARLKDEIEGQLDVKVHYKATPEEGLLFLDMNPSVRLVVVDAAVGRAQYSLSEILKQFRERSAKRPFGTIIVITDQATSAELRRLKLTDSAVTHPILLPELAKLLVRMYNRNAPATGEHKAVQAEIL